MLKITQEAIDSHCAVQNRGDEAEYYKRLIDEVAAENKPLFQAITRNAWLTAKEIVDMQGDIRDDVKRYIISSMITSALAVYHAINIQLEANELEKIYGS